MGLRIGPNLCVSGGNPHGAVPVVLLEETRFEEAGRRLKPRARLVLHGHGPEILSSTLERRAGVFHAHGFTTGHLARVPHALPVGRTFFDHDAVGLLRRAFFARAHAPAERRRLPNICRRDELICHQPCCFRFSTRFVARAAA